MIRNVKKTLIKNRLVKVYDFWGATLACINYSITSILKKKTDVVVLNRDKWLYQSTTRDL